MRRSAALIALFVLCGANAVAQTASPTDIPFALEGVSLGESMQQVRSQMGDPVRYAVQDAPWQIWSYIEHDGALYVDVMTQNNVVIGVTVVRRFKSSPYTDPAGIAFGTSSDGVRQVRGTPTRVTTNADDGSVDLWYLTDKNGIIYEFYGDKLGFVQVLASPSYRKTLPPGPAAAPAGGTSEADAIAIRPSNMMLNTAWIDAYMAMNQCGSNGHWKELSSKFTSDVANGDIMAYTHIQAQCTDGSATREFVFDTHGALTTKGAGGLGSGNTIYIDASQLQKPEHVSSTPSPSPSPAASPR